MAREIEGCQHLALWFGLVGWLVGWLPKVLRCRHRDRETSKEGPLTPHFIVSVVQGPELVRLHSVTELCSLRVSVETYITPKGSLQWKHCQCFSLTQHNCSYAPRCVACGETHLRGVLYLTAAARVLQLWRKPHSPLSGLCEVEGGQGGA